MIYNFVRYDEIIFSSDQMKTKKGAV